MYYFEGRPEVDVWRMFSYIEVQVWDITIFKREHILFIFFIID